ncbi:UL16-binding protein 2-like isoform X2 [Mustela lutreola]|uniref:UL16-binding protein 2-like isoform X2 n=1 Tax=Mustela lutreola TaxID=9666 RepID=UPI002796F2CF|nr:UL16-binding protein 2-like isoform X2 [Mustela lutreola]
MRDRCPLAQPRPGHSKHVLPPGPRVPSEATRRLAWDSPRLGAAMGPTAATKFRERLPLLFLLLLLRLPAIAAAPSGLGVGATRGGDALSLSYHFFITSQAKPGQPWCEVQGQINGKTFLSYDCQTKEFKPIGPWGMKLKDRSFWQQQEETVKLLVEELRKKLLDIKAENFTKSGSLTMQGRLMCERGADGHTRASWQFRFNESITYRFDPNNRKWTVDHSGGQQVKDMLDGDRELTMLLVRTSNGDCQSWLQQVWEHWDETQETTGAPATTLHVALFKGAAIRPIASVFLVVLTHSVLLVVQGIVL